jgi:hypothetical protein
VVEEPDVDEPERLLDSLSDELVRLARLGNARRMVVRDDDCRGVTLQRELDDLARMDARAVDRSAKQLLELDQAMPFVEIQAALIIYWVAI